MLLFILILALSISWRVSGQQLETVTLTLTGSTSMVQHFLAMSSIPAVQSMSVQGGFENQHVTVLNIQLLTASTPTAEGQSTNTYLYLMGSLVVGFNDHSYTHMRVESTAFPEQTLTRASCTRPATLDSFWTCNSVVEITSLLSASSATVTTTVSTQVFPSSTVQISDHMYMMEMGSILRGRIETPRSTSSGAGSSQLPTTTSLAVSSQATST